MIGKILLALLLIPVAYFVMLVIVGLLAGVLGVTVYYGMQYLFIGLIALAIVWIISEYRKGKGK